MTGRERFIAVAEGQPADRIPVLYWPGPSDGRSDAVVLPADPAVVKSHDRTDNRAILVEILNPFGRCWARNIYLNDLFVADPAEAERLLATHADVVRKAISSTLDAGADGIIYRIHGATADHISRGEYAERYLDLDRQLLNVAVGAVANIIFVVGETNLYLDLLHDLPAQFFGWDNRTTGIPEAEGRYIRQGCVATFDGLSDLQLVTSSPSTARILEHPRRQASAM